jgi:hypothetical protein
MSWTVLVIIPPVEWFSPQSVTEYYGVSQS